MDISSIRKLPSYLIALLLLVNHTVAASPRDDIEHLVREIGPMVVFEIPGTTFHCLGKEDYDALGPQTAAMRTINGLGCKAVINNWMGAEVTPDGLTWWFVSHGGHNAYGGNEAYRLDLSADRPWSLHSLPSPRAKYRLAQDGSVRFVEDVQWTGCPAAVAETRLKRQKKAARSCTKYGPGAIHTWSLPAYMNGRIYLRGWGSFGSGIHQGAWIFDPAKACIEADRAVLIENLARLNPQNVIADCDPSAAWTYLGQRGPGVATPLPQSDRILYSWQNPSQGALEDASGNVIRDSGAFGGTSTYSGVHTQWIPSLEIGVINKRAERWFYVTADGDVQSPRGVKNHSSYATVDTRVANTKIIGHFSYDPNSEHFLILEDTRLFFIEREDLEDNDKAEFHEASLDWSRIRDPRPMPYNGFVHIASLDVHCMMNRGDLGKQSLMCFRYSPTTGKKPTR
jgi:hypothetical protein